MGLFTNNYEDFEYRYRVSYLGDADEVAQTKDALCIDLEFYGDYQGRGISAWGSFQYYDEAGFDDMLQFLSEHENTVAVKVSIHKKNVQRFKVDLKDMAEKLGDERPKRLELLASKVTLL